MSENAIDTSENAIDMSANGIDISKNEISQVSLKFNSCLRNSIIVYASYAFICIFISP